MKFIPHINPYHYNSLMKKCREFFEAQGLIECSLNNRITILAACESPETVVSFEYLGKSWSLQQTTQMLLEEQLLLEGESCKNGFYNISTSYRNEQNPIEGRHCLIFPMAELELLTDMDGMVEFQKNLLEHLGFGPKASYVEVNYVDMCEKYGVTELTHEHEGLMGKEYGNVVFLKYFPSEESFWNMARCQNPKFCKKVDVLLGSSSIKMMETIGSAERSVDVKQMRESFETISDGKYAGLLYEKFGKDRVDQEMDEYLSYKMFQRSGMGIGITRLMDVMISLNLL